MAETRAGVLSGQDIVLRVLVVDDSGFPRDTDALPVVYIYDDTLGEDDIRVEVEDETYTSAVAGPFTATRLGLGYYEYEYSVPSSVDDGTWSDVWVAELDGVAIYDIRNFNVTSGATFETQTLKNNELIIVELNSTIATAADSTITLEADTTLYFTTVFVPFYASVELVRMEAGPLIDYIPDDTLALMIHWASKEVDAIKPSKICGDRFPFWRTKFVIFDTVLRAVSLPGGAYLQTLNTGSGGSKTLGELSIKRGNIGPGDVMSGGIDKDTYKEIKKARDEFWRVVNAGGCINPGQGLGPETAIRGLYDPARRQMGRQWLSPDEFRYIQPTSNTKLRREGERMHRSGFTTWRPRHSIGQLPSSYSAKYYRGKYYYGT